MLAGLFGVGGGGVIVPVLYEIFRVMQVPEDVRMQLCVGTSLAIIIPTSIRSFRAHRARRDLPVEILRAWALPVTAGVVIGGVIAAFAPGAIFKIAFVVIALLIGAKFLFGRETLEARRYPAGPVPDECLRPHHRALFGADGGRRRIGVDAILVFYGQRSTPRSGSHPASAC